MTSWSPGRPGSRSAVPTCKSLEKTQPQPGLLSVRDTPQILPSPSSVGHKSQLTRRQGRKAVPGRGDMSEGREAQHSVFCSWF